MQREQSVEHRRPAPLAPGEPLGVGAEVDRQAYPGRPALVVSAHAVHHRDDVGRAGQVRRDRTSRPLPARPETLPGSHDVVEVAGERVDKQAPGHRQVILVAVERQVGERVGVGRGTGQVAGGQIDLGGHEIAVSELETGERPDRERV